MQGSAHAGIDWTESSGKRRMAGGVGVLVIKQLRVDGRQVPWSLTLSVLCWLIPGVWSGLGTLIPLLS